MIPPKVRLVARLDAMEKALEFTKEEKEIFLELVGLRYRKEKVIIICNNLPIREQNAEALVPFRDDLEKIKEMIHDVEVNEAETVAFSEQREMRKKLRIPDSVEWIPDSLYWSPIWRKKNFTDPKSAFFDREYECIF